MVQREECAPSTPENRSEGPNGAMASGWVHWGDPASIGRWMGLTGPLDSVDAYTNSILWSTIPHCSNGYCSNFGDSMERAEEWLWPCIGNPDLFPAQDHRRSSRFSRRSALLPLETVFSPSQAVHVHGLGLGVDPRIFLDLPGWSSYLFLGMGRKNLFVLF